MVKLANKHKIYSPQSRNLNLHNILSTLPGHYFIISCSPVFNPSIFSILIIILWFCNNLTCPPLFISISSSVVGVDLIRKICYLGSHCLWKYNKKLGGKAAANPICAFIIPIFQSMTFLIHLSCLQSGLVSRLRESTDRLKRKLKSTVAIV